MISSVSELILAALGVLLVFNVLAYVIRYVRHRPSDRFPPGPPRVPLLGSYPFLLALNYRHLHRAAAKLSELYGSNILGLYLGPLPAVIVNDHALVRQVLHRSEFEGRPDLFLARLRDEQYARRGIFFTDGDSWRDQRKFFLKTLHEYGFGRRNDNVEQDLQAGLEELISLLKEGPKHDHERALLNASGYALCPQLFFALFSNVMLRMLTASRLEREDQAVLFEVGANSLAFHRQGDDYGLALSYIPWIRHVLPGFSRYRLLREVNQKANGVIKSLAEQCEKTYDENDTRCFIDAYIREIRRNGTKATTGTDCFGFEYDQLVIGCADFLVPAFSAVPAKLGLMLERLVSNPEVVKRMLEEIQLNVGHVRLPLLDDRANMPYCEAVVREALRIDTLVPSGIPHVATVDTELAGYQLPRGTLVINGLDKVNHQEDIFENAESFRPERFLDVDGKLCLAKDMSLPFGAGKRVCAGETFARNALFLTVTTLVQQFEFCTECPPEPKHHLTGVIRTTPDYRIKFSCFYSLRTIRHGTGSVTSEMFITTSVLLWGTVCSLLLYYFYRSTFNRPAKFPPGPPRLPFLGDYGTLLLINNRHLHKAATALCNFYRTKLLGVSLVNFPAVVVNDLALAREVLNRKEFDGRPDLYLARMRDKNFNLRGIFFTDGPNWKEQRWFILRYLRDYGFGRRFPAHEAEVNSELLNLIDVLKHGPKFEHEKSVMKDGYVKCPNILFAPFASAFLQIVTGERFTREESGILYETGKNAMVFQRKGDDYGTILSYFPWTRFIYPISRKYEAIRNASLAVNNFIDSIINKYQSSYDENHIRCFLDLYFQEMKKTTPKEANEFTFQPDQMVLGLVDFFFPAISGATTQVAMLLERLLHNPHVVERMQQEIDQVVGQGRLPTLDDRPYLSFTEATLREGMRIDTLVPSGVAHRAQSDTTLQGYELPKDCFLLIGMDAMHNQKEYWGDPETFRPERFLDDAGKLCLAKDMSLPFGAGKRLCAGETFARNIMFLTLAALMQNFNLRQPPSDRLPDLSKRSTGVIISPADYWLRFEPR
ncbi:uncharacterized protein LOC131207498 [Anopheles bellator]|uniref:uncharacterized protein LOC131207498 n=1 Tax=Anopheles bellator TaxID=139047 RepID=UPI002647B83D|nr:uncharacterized protein LOC131207498 [Anopheles bellator]